MPEAYRVAVIGRTGRGDYGHGLDVVWRDRPGVEVVAVADESAEGRAAAAKRTGAKRAYADYREMLEKERPQIASVAPRWLDCHRDMVLACAAHHCHVFLEKPMARTLAEADEMVDACERAHVKLAIAHQTRYSPRLEKVKEMIARGDLGEILELRGRGKEDSRGGGEDLMVLGTHVMDLIRFLAGEARWCYAQVLERGRRVTRAQVRDGAEGIGPLAGDQVDAMYGLANGATAYFSTRRNAGTGGSRFGLSVYGSKGVLELTTGTFPPVYLLAEPSWSAGRGHREWLEVTSAGPGQPEPLKLPPGSDLHDGNARIAMDLMRAVETDSQPRGSMYDGRAALEMILAVYESHRMNAPVPLPLRDRSHPLGRL
jgi:predicted dehydrogenase